MFFVNLIAGYIVIRVVPASGGRRACRLLLLIVLATALACGGRCWRLRRCSWCSGDWPAFYGAPDSVRDPGTSPAVEGPA